MGDLDEKEEDMVRLVSLVLIVPVVLSACASSTTINSIPSGAKVYLDGSLVGTTPYVHEDMKVAGTVKTVVLKKEGYRDYDGTIRKEEVKVGPLIGGVLILFPAIWVLGYPKQYTFELQKE